MKKRARIFFRGHVQGVGFRFTAEKVATDLFLSGWVRNTRDGGVEVLCEGQIDDINAMVEVLKKEMPHYISNVEIEWLEPNHEFTDFKIKVL